MIDYRLKHSSVINFYRLFDCKLSSTSCTTRSAYFYFFYFATPLKWILYCLDQLSDPLFAQDRSHPQDGKVKRSSEQILSTLSASLRREFALRRASGFHYECHSFGFSHLSMCCLWKGPVPINQLING